jgi:hypothetical protein
LAENANLEIAKHLHELGRQEHAPNQRREEILEIVEAVLLAAVAIVTAWSGYQAALWDGESARHYAEAVQAKSESVEQALESGQMLMYNTGTFNAWLQAETSGQKEVARLLTHRFTPEYRVAFDAWLKTNPLNDPNAPVGPRVMPEYKEPHMETANALRAQAAQSYRSGVDARHTGEEHVSLTVVLATVLFLIAVGQRFRIKGVRATLLGVAAAFLTAALVMLWHLPTA